MKLYSLLIGISVLEVTAVPMFIVLFTVLHERTNARKARATARAIGGRLVICESTVSWRRVNDTSPPLAAAAVTSATIDPLSAPLIG